MTKVPEHAQNFRAKCCTFYEEFSLLCFVQGYEEMNTYYHLNTKAIFLFVSSL